MAKIHKTAIVSRKAELAKDVTVGPYAIIGDNVKIGKGVAIGASVVLDGWTTIGEGCEIFTGAVIGSASQDKKFKKGIKSFLKIGSNNKIREYVTMNPGTEEGSSTVVGNDNLIMAYSHVAHDCVIGNGVVIANVGTFAGHVTIEDRAVIGGLVAVHQFVRVGTLSIIGGCSKVNQDVPPYSMVDGNPAKLYGINAVGLRRAGLNEATRIEIKRAMRILCQTEISLPHAISEIKKNNIASKELNRVIDFLQTSQRGIIR